MTSISRQLAAFAFTALASITLLAGAVGPAAVNAPVAQTARIVA